MKRLMDVGLRPGKIIALSLAELNAMADARAPARRDDLAPALERDVLAMLHVARRRGAAGPRSPTC